MPALLTSTVGGPSSAATRPTAAVDGCRVGDVDPDGERLAARRRDRVRPFRRMRPRRGRAPRRQTRRWRAVAPPLHRCRALLRSRSRRGLCWLSWWPSAQNVQVTWEDNGMHQATDHRFVAAPKALLHDHLDGGLRPETVLELADEVGHGLPATSADELGRWFVDGGRLGHPGALPRDVRPHRGCDAAPRPVAPGRSRSALRTSPPTASCMPRCATRRSSTSRPA